MHLQGMVKRSLCGWLRVEGSRGERGRERNTDMDDDAELDNEARFDGETSQTTRDEMRRTGVIRDKTGLNETQMRRARLLQFKTRQ